MRQSLGHLGGLYLDQDSWVGFEEGGQKWRRNIRETETETETEEKQQHIVCGPRVHRKLLASPMLRSGSLGLQPTQSNIKREQLTPQPQDSQTLTLSPGEREEN